VTVERAADQKAQEGIVRVHPLHEIAGDVEEEGLVALSLNARVDAEPALRLGDLHLEDGAVEIVLGGEVLEDERLAHPGRARDRARGRARVPRLREEVEGRFDDGARSLFRRQPGAQRQFRSLLR
jgi:hypothetical protein